MPKLEGIIRAVRRLSLTAFSQMMLYTTFVDEMYDEAGKLSMLVDCHAQTGPTHQRSGGGGCGSYGSHKWSGTSFDCYKLSPGSFVAAITGPTLPQLVLLFVDQWCQPYLVRGPVMVVQTGPGPIIADQTLSGTNCSFYKWSGRAC